MSRDVVDIGTPLVIKKVVEKPKKKYRIVIQEKPALKNDVEKSRSFIINDYHGDSSIDLIKEKLMNIK